MKAKNQCDWKCFRNLRKKVKKELKVSKVLYFEQICHDAAHQPRKMWREVNKVLGRGHNGGISIIRSDKGELSGATDIVEEFNRYFSSFMSTQSRQGGPTSDWVSYMTTVGQEASFLFSRIDEDMVRKILYNLNLRKATGTDGISARLLKRTAPAIARSLTHLFNCSMEMGALPEEWKAAHVTPVHKQGDKETFGNYRPVSVLPVVVKVFEAVIHAQLYAYMESNALIHPAQSGFCPRHSTQDVLVKTVDDWRKALDRDEVVGTVLADLSKAFDMIDHSKLLEKLYGYGIRGKELIWFENYLRAESRG